MKHPLEASVEEQKRLARERFKQRGEQSASSLSKREHFAAMAMQAWLSTAPVHDTGDEGPWLPAKTAQLAVAYADALLAELETRK